jgi:L-alanine-DL-glutamate epimerase-like enolase superfamily enzyme
MANRLDDFHAFAEAGRLLALPGQRAAQACFDSALHDLAGRRLGVQCGSSRSRAGRSLRTSWTIG